MLSNASIAASLLPRLSSNIDLITSTSNVGNMSFIEFKSSSVYVGAAGLAAASTAATAMTASSGDVAVFVDGSLNWNVIWDFVSFACVYESGSRANLSVFELDSAVRLDRPSYSTRLSTTVTYLRALSIFEPAPDALLCIGHRFEELL